MSHTSTNTRTDQWLATHTAGLIAYAKHDHHFTHTLVRTVLSLIPEQIARPVDTPELRFLTPLDTDHATTVARWLLGRVQDGRYPQTTGLLASWAADVRDRDFIVMGLGGTMIPGLTVGDPSVKKKKRAQLQVVFADAWYADQTTTDIATLTARLSHRTIARELARVGGDSYALHPDTAEWFLADPMVKSYLAPADELANLERAAIEERVELEQHEAHTRTIALAIAPSVQDTFVEERSIERIR